MPALMAVRVTGSTEGFQRKLQSGPRMRCINVMRRVAYGMIRDYQATTATWEHKVHFGYSMRFPSGGVYLRVGTDDEIYNYVDRGTRPHRIAAKHAPALRFMTTFTPKTRPRFIGSGPGRKAPPWASKQAVNHPGTKARLFSYEIARKWQPLFKAEILSTLYKWARE